MTSEKFRPLDIVSDGAHRLYRQLMTYPMRNRIGSGVLGPPHSTQGRPVGHIRAGGGRDARSSLARRATGRSAAAAMPSEPHAIVRSSRKRTDEHQATWPISKATAHTKACAAPRRANMEQSSTQSVIRHTEEVLAGDEAAAPGV